MQRTRLIVAVAAACLLAVPAMAQGQEGRGAGRRGQQTQRMTPEQAEAAWTLQARSIASQFGVEDTGVIGMTSVYVQARKDYNQALIAARQNRGGGQGRPGRGGGEGRGGATDDTGQERGAGRGEGGRQGQGREAGGPGGARGGGMNAQIAEVRKAHREKLQTALSSYLADDKLKKAVAVLGSFDRNYDTMTHAVSGLKLEDDTTMKAMTPVNQYVAGLGKLADMEREARRDAMTDLRTQLKSGLDPLLDDEQMAAFEKATQPRQRGGRRGGGTRGGSRGGGGGLGNDV